MDFDENFKAAVFSLNLVGSHPNTKSNKIRFSRFCFWHGSFTVTAFFILYSVLFYDIRTDIPLACANFSLYIIYWYTGLGNFMLYVYREDFSKIISVIQKDYKSASKYPMDEKDIILKYARYGKNVVKIWMLLLFVFFFMFIIKPIGLMVYFSIFSEFKYVLAAELTYPPSIQKYENTFPLWFFNVTSVFISEIYATCMYVAMVSMGPVYMLHACGQLELLKKRVLQIFPEDKEISFEERELMLKHIAWKLQEIYTYIDYLKNSFKLFYEVSLKGTSLIIPVLAYQIVDSIRKGEMEIEVTGVLLFDAVAVSAFPCYFGDKIIQKSEEFRDAVYSSRWETMFDKRARTSILVIMTRTERSVAISSVFRNVSMVALADVLNQAYVIFNAINTAMG